MAAVKKQYRWVCPRCGAGVNAPSRLRKDDTRRYCLYCSDKTGRLVERECLNRLRKQQAARAKRARQAKRARVKNAVKRAHERSCKQQAQQAAKQRTQDAKDRAARHKRLTIIHASGDSPDASLWIKVTERVFEDALDLGVTCVRQGGWARYVPRWYVAIAGRLTPEQNHGRSSLYPTWGEGLIRYIVRDPQLLDGCVAMASMDPDSVLPFVADNYPFPMPPHVIQIVEGLRK